MGKYTIDDLINIVARLRAPDGCPWDRAQTHDSIKKDLIEESYEAIDALDNGTDKDFANELGDILLQVVFHSQLGRERNAFDFDTVLEEICTKLITRHTHVFGDVEVDGEAEALANWEKNKKKEKGLATYTDVLKDVPSYYPALMRAKKVQKKAAGFGFDWTEIDSVYDKLYEEIDEVKAAAETGNQKAVEEGFGDLLFAAVNLSRFLGVDAETALAAGCNKFVKRFEKMEKAAVSQGLDFAQLSLDETDKLWESVKITEK